MKNFFRPSARRPVPRRVAILAAVLLAVALAGFGCGLFKKPPTAEDSVLTAAYDFRWLATSHYVKALSTYAEPAVIARFKTYDDLVWPATDPRVGWAFFFNTAIMAMGGSFNNITTVAYYHPWSDVFLVTAWYAPPGASPRLYDAEVLVGDFIRRSGQPKFSTSRPWMRKNEYRPVAVGLSTAETIRNFEYFFKAVQPTAAGWRSVLPGLSEANTLAANHYAAGSMLMANLGELSGIVAPQDDAGRALKAKLGRIVFNAIGGDLRELTSAPQSTPESNAALAGLHPAFLRRFQVAAFIGGKKKSLVMLTRPDNPDSYLALLFKNGGNKWSLERADLLSFQKFYALGPQAGGN